MLLECLKLWSLICIFWLEWCWGWSLFFAKRSTGFFFPNCVFSASMGDCKRSWLTGRNPAFENRYDLALILTYRRWILTYIEWSLMAVWMLSWVLIDNESDFDKKMLNLRIWPTLPVMEPDLHLIFMHHKLKAPWATAL